MINRIMFKKEYRIYLGESKDELKRVREESIEGVLRDMNAWRDDNKSPNIISVAWESFRGCSTDDNPYWESAILTYEQEWIC